MNKENLKVQSDSTIALQLMKEGDAQSHANRQSLLIKKQLQVHLRQYWKEGNEVEDAVVDMNVKLFFLIPPSEQHQIKAKKKRKKKENSNTNSTITCTNLNLDAEKGKPPFFLKPQAPARI